MNNVTQLIADLTPTSKSHHASGMCLIALWSVKLAEACEEQGLIRQNRVRDGRKDPLGIAFGNTRIYTCFIKGAQLPVTAGKVSEELFYRALRLTMLATKRRGMLIVFSGSAPPQSNGVNACYARGYRFEPRTLTPEELVSIAESFTADALTFLQTGVWRTHTEVSSGFSLVETSEKQSAPNPQPVGSSA